MVYFWCLNERVLTRLILGSEVKIVKQIFTRTTSECDKKCKGVYTLEESASEYQLPLLI